jgi:ABC-type branched-subunit amino acid transport system ATPase component
VKLGHLRGEYGGRLSYGQQKLLKFAHALMTDPDVILLDEPAAGVNRTLLQDLLDHIHRLQAMGKTILIVERHGRDHEPLRVALRHGLRGQDRGGAGRP